MLKNRYILIVIIKLGVIYSNFESTGFKFYRELYMVYLRIKNDVSWRFFENMLDFYG